MKASRIMSDAGALRLIRNVVHDVAHTYCSPSQCRVALQFQIIARNARGLRQPRVHARSSIERMR
jgi:hypothetical protein